MARQRHCFEGAGSLTPSSPGESGDNRCRTKPLEQQWYRVGVISMTVRERDSRQCASLGDLGSDCVSMLRELRTWVDNPD